MKMERLQKVIANSGYTSRRKAEELITRGKVTVNGKKVTELGVKVTASDVILVEGNAISQEAEKEYYLLYKPRGVISSTKDEKGRKTVVDLIPTRSRIYPIGRLDYDTTGILLLTNDGEFANCMMHPKYEIERTYIAKLDGLLEGPQIYQLNKGIVLDGKKCHVKRFKIRSVDKKKQTCIVEVTLIEGKYHEVKRIFEAVGRPVLKLKRETYGFLTLEGLKSGEYRSLSPKEVKQLYNYVTNK